MAQANALYAGTLALPIRLMSVANHCAESVPVSTSAVFRGAIEGRTSVTLLPLAVKPTTATAVIAAYDVQLGAACLPGGSCVLPMYVTPYVGKSAPNLPTIEQLLTPFTSSEPKQLL